MSICGITFLGICFSSFGLNDIHYERHAGLEMTAFYENYSVRVVSKDYIQRIDRTKVEEICLEDVCAAYHLYCEDLEEGIFCEYELQRDDRVESLSIQFIGGAESFSKAQSKIAIIMGTDVTQTTSLEKFYLRNFEQEWPKNTTPTHPVWKHEAD